MFHEIRRKDRIMDAAQSKDVLHRGEYGVLASVDADNQPYGVPLSYVYMDDAVYFHCAREGHKIENISANPKVCFTVTGNTLPVYDKSFTTYYESVVIFGTAEQVTDDARKTAILIAIAGKYLPEHMDKAPSDIAKSLERTAVYRINIEIMTGKHKCPA